MQNTWHDQSETENSEKLIEISSNEIQTLVNSPAQKSLSETEGQLVLSIGECPEIFSSKVFLAFASSEIPLLKRKTWQRRKQGSLGEVKWAMNKH